MPTFLESLYYGNLKPSEAIVPRDPHYRHLSRQLSESMEMLKKRLPSEDFKELEALHDLYQQLHGMELTASFSKGFKMGAAMALEVYEEKMDK